MTIRQGKKCTFPDSSITYTIHSRTYRIFLVVRTTSVQGNRAYRLDAQLKSTQLTWKEQREKSLLSILQDQLRLVDLQFVSRGCQRLT